MSAALRYGVCGLTLASESPIAGLRPHDGGGAVDVHVALRHGAPMPAPVVDVPWYVSDERDERGRPLLVAAPSRADGSRWLQYSEGIAFRIDAAANRIDAWWQPPLTEVDAATYLLGPVLAFAMRLRGTVPLHASAVAIGGRAAIFVGDAGAGKSTTAAAFATLGFPVLSDDIVPVAPGPDAIRAWPGYPRVSLWSDSADALFGAEPGLPAFSESYQKRYLDLDGAQLPFQSAPLPVGVIYVLASRDGRSTPAVNPLGSRAGLLALLAQTYGSYLIDPGMRATEFDVLARVAAHVSVREVRFGDTLQGVRQACAALLEAEHCTMAAPAR